MEGRARARPGPETIQPDRGVAVPSMEGRARARPGTVIVMVWAKIRSVLQWRAGHVPGLVLTPSSSAGCGTASFNGGPGTCPAWFQ